MKSSSPQSTVLWQIVGIICMSIAIGALLIIAFETWLRGDPFIVWVAALALFVIATYLYTRAFVKRIS
jgi:hypothetical protein